MLTAYHLRGGGETAIKASKQGLGLTKRNKQQFAAQEILVLLAQLAYNLIVCFHQQANSATPAVLPLGIQRMVRDVFHISGQLELDDQGRLLQVSLHATHSLAIPFVQALSSAWTRSNLYHNLRQI